MLVLLVAIALCLAGAAHAATVSLPQTGQTTSYAAGDDGALQKGVAWPNPRFTVNSDQTVNDNLTGLVWTKDAGTPTVGSCAGGKMTWQAALDYVSCLNTANYLGYNDWRMPNVNELESLVNAEQATPATWLFLQVFANVQSNAYWSSTSYASNTSYAWFVSMVDGNVSGSGLVKSRTYYVWPVRAGQSGAFGNSFIWFTGQTATYTVGDDGTLQKGMVWPNPRFTDNGNQTVTDNLTGLVWTRHAGTPTVGSCVGGAMTWQAAFSYVACLNTANYLGYNNWRLPNRKELFSLVDHGMYNPSLPSGHPFSYVQTDDYWSSTSLANNTSYAWVVYSYDGYVNYSFKTGSLYVWPVRTWSAPCTYTLNPTSKGFTSTGGSDSVGVTATTGCAWTATSNNTDWITITSGSAGSGNGI
ncbi:MAG: DUF1566 domain-containing protein, partial [Nitrospirae bacterium]|nr:DUF1566 domain-containing protein [Nitrospirota bacterium]